MGLKMKIVDWEVFCKNCGAEVIMSYVEGKNNFFVCAECGARNVVIVHNVTFEIEKVDDDIYNEKKDDLSYWR